MNTDIMQVSMKEISVKMIEPMRLKEACRSMAVALPEWFCNREAKPPIEQDTQSPIIFAASINHEYVGIMIIQLSSSTNAHINWMVVSEAHQLQSIGRKLLLVAENYCYEYGYSSLTVETLNPKQNDMNNLKTYHFYEKSGFKVLFERYNSEQNLSKVYVLKILSLDDFSFIDLTHPLSSDVPHWGIDAGFKYNARYIQSTESPGDVKFRVQRLEMSAGIGTHMDAPSHCFENAPAIDAIPIQSLRPCA
jgi:GNAT superfamily N-acetyltransferase